MIIHYIGAKMKISEKLDKLKNEKLEACEALKTSIKELSKSKDKEDSKIQEALMNMCGRSKQPNRRNGDNDRKFTSNKPLKLN